MLTNENLLDRLVEFSDSLKYEDLPPVVVHEAKRRLIDSLACMVAGTKDPAACLADKYLDMPFAAFLPSVSESAFRYTHLIRVLDWNDTYLSKEPAHPSDNIGALLALLRYNASGKDFLIALVLAYEIQCRFCDAASLRKNGWDHTAYVALASALASAKLLQLNSVQMKQAAALALRWIPLRQVRGGSQLSMAKGLSAAEAVKFAVHSVKLASCGITGPSEILEGQFGFIKQATGPLDFSAFESLGQEFKILKTHIKLYPVEYHAQAAVNAAIYLRRHQYWKGPEAIRRIELESYEACKNIIADPSKRRPTTKESADHSLFYILAITLLDGEMTLKQYEPQRFTDPAVLALIDKMSDVKENKRFNKIYLDRQAPGFPLRCRIITDNSSFQAEVLFPKGHYANPLSDQELTEKFNSLIGDNMAPVNKEKFLCLCWDIGQQAGLFNFVSDFFSSIKQKSAS